MRYFRFLIAFCVALLASGLSFCADKAQFDSPAHIQIGERIVNSDVNAFSATIGEVGNSLIRSGGGFEPVIYRTALIARENSQNSVIGTWSDVSHWDTLREGALDGADVSAYRIEDGAFKLVREDRVSDGGFLASGWIGVTKKNELVASDSNSYRFSWDDYNRPKVEYFFTVRSVDHFGNLSDFATPVSVIPEKIVKTHANENRVLPFSKRSSPDKRKSPPTPKNLNGLLESDGSFTLSWDTEQSSEIAGYAVFRSDYHPDLHRGYSLNLLGNDVSSRQDIRAGDLVVVRKKFYSTSRNSINSNRVWGAGSVKRKFLPGLIEFYSDESEVVQWSLEPHKSGTPVEDSGETYLELRKRTAVPVEIGLYNHAGTEQDWYEVLAKESYTVEVWLRSESGGEVEFGFEGFYANSAQKIKPIVFQPTPEWKKYTASFQPTVENRNQKGIGKMHLNIQGAGKFGIDNFRVYRSNTNFLDLSNDDYDELSSANVSSLRTHSLIKTGNRTYDVEQLTNTGGAISGTARQNTLPQLLGIVRRAGVDPWLQIEPHFSAAEWLDLMEYLAGSYGPTDSPSAKPWAHKRVAQGQLAPWVQEFEKIYFEIGNETWNGLFQPWTFSSMTDAVTGKRYAPGEVYGLYQEYVIAIFRSSPYWSNELEQKFVFALGGWSGQKYGRDAASLSPSSEMLAYAAYNGGWDEDEGPPSLNPASYFHVMNQVAQQAIPRAKQQIEEISELNEHRVIRLEAGTYEAGPGYAMNGLNGAKVSNKEHFEQELVMKSQAAGVATLDSFLARSYQGFSQQNFFTFGSGELWKSHAKWYRGGQAYPSWMLIALFNTLIANQDMLETSTISSPEIDLKAFRRREAVDGARLIAVYAFRKDRHYSVVVLSRKIPDYPQPDDGYTAVELELPFENARSVTLYRMDSGYSSANTRSKSVAIEKINVDPAYVRGRLTLSSETGADDRGLSPASAYLYLIEAN